MPAELWTTDPTTGLDTCLREVITTDPATGLDTSLKEIWTGDPATGLDTRVFTSGIRYTTTLFTDYSGGRSSVDTNLNATGSGRFRGDKWGGDSSGSVYCGILFKFDTPIQLLPNQEVFYFAFDGEAFRYSEAKIAWQIDRITTGSGINALTIAGSEYGTWNEKSLTNTQGNKVVNALALLFWTKLRSTVENDSSNSYESYFYCHWNSGGIKLLGHPILAPSGILPIKQ